MRALASCVRTFGTRYRLLVQRQKRLAGSFARDGAAGRLDSDHGVFEGAEAADTGLIQSYRSARGKVLRCRRPTGTGGREDVSALGAAGQYAIDQAPGGCGRGAGSDAAQVAQCRGKAHGRIRGAVSNLSGVDGADRT